MAYNNIIARTDAAALQPNQTIVNEIIKGVTEGSAILPLMTKLPNMTSKQSKLNVMSSLPEAYFVDGEPTDLSQEGATGLKNTTKAAWENKYIYAEEIAVVVPISQNVLDDSEYDIWGEIKPKIVEQFYKLIDKAIITGTGKPASWRAGLVPSIVTATKQFNATSNLYKDISKAMGFVEESGYDATGILGGVKLKAKFRDGLLDTTGQPLANSEVTELTRSFVKNGAWNDTLASYIVGDFKQAVYAIRSDIDFKVFDTGVVTDNSGNIIYNLMQQDMVALRVTMRLGWEIPNPVNALDGTATRFPFASVK